jgi:phosphate transport system permease protein
MFVAAMVPLLSLLQTVISRGAERFDVDFFTMTMRNVIGEGGGACTPSPAPSSSRRSRP